MKLGLVGPIKGLVFVDGEKITHEEKFWGTNFGNPRGPHFLTHSAARELGGNTKKKIVLDDPETPFFPKGFGMKQAKKGPARRKYQSFSQKAL